MQVVARSAVKEEESEELRARALAYEVKLAACSGPVVLSTVFAVLCYGIAATYSALVARAIHNVKAGVVTLA
eukprot:3766347-Amphidinium_carterae.2